MPTEKQKLAVEKIVENRGRIGPSMIEAGYKENTAKNPKNLTESKGFKEICEQCGLTDELILNSLTEDIKKKPQNRKPELELGAKIKGMLVDRTDITSKGEKIVFERINYAEDTNPIPIQTETIPDSISEGTASREEEIGSGVASEIGEG